MRLDRFGQRTYYIADAQGCQIEIGSRNKPYEGKNLTEG